ncbi:MAG: peptide/nickel transport system permease protein [Myxococcota bacterium]|jgi:peptide/nickel transport system permease protein
MSWPARIGALVVLTLMVVGLGSPVLAPYPEGYRDIEHPLAGPSDAHRLGTTEDGADVLSALCHGARVALIVGLCTVALSVAIGTLIGLISGWYGGWIDEAIMRLIEMFLSFPGFLLALLIVFSLGEATMLGVILALNVTGWAGYARLVRGQVLTVKRREFVLAAVALGASTPRILRKHLLPNVFGPVTVQATFGIAGAILAEASLSFLGVGPQDVTSWGALLDEGAILFLKTPWLAMLSGGCLFVTVLGVNLLGDALRDRLDPRSL